MVTLIDSIGPYQLPTGWHEVTTSQYCEVDRAKFYTVEQRASFFAGRPIQVNGYVATVLAFMLHPIPLDAGLAYPPDLGQETFMQVESIRAMLLKQPLHECFALVYCCFKGRYNNWGSSQFDQGYAYRYAERCLDWPITDTYPAVAHCLAELARLDQAFAALAEPDQTDAGRKARAAGAERLATFSHLNVARHYAERLGTTIADVYQWPWQQVAMFLLQDKITAEIQDNLSKQKDD